MKRKINWKDLETLKFIKERLINGKGYAEIARELKINNSTLRKKCIKLGLDKYYKESRDKRIQEKEDKIFEKHLRLYAHSNLPHTRKYLIDNLKKDPDFRTYKGIMLKEDFIEQYYETRKRSGTPIFKYDFSQLPDIITGRYERLKIFVNEISTKTKKVIGNWETNIREFIINEKENRSIRGMLSKTKTKQYISNEEFIRRSKELFGDHAPGFDKLNYINQKTPVILKCHNCGEYFSQMPNEHFSGTGYCHDCAMKLCGEKKLKSTEDFIKEVEEKYGKDVWDFSKLNYKGSDTKVTLIYKETGEECTHNPHYFLDGKDPRKSVIYKGESMVENVLKSLEIQNYEKQKNIPKSDLIKFGLDKSERTRILVDFYLEYNNVKYIIEYNGIQHYEYTSFLHRDDINLFKKQVSRDNLLKKYCINNNIILIEIPYTYNSFDKIKIILNDIFINNKSIEKTIIIPRIQSLEEE